MTARIRSIGAFAMVAMLSALLAGCGDKESKFYGTYKNPKDNSALVLQAEHKGTYEAMGTKTDITWEKTGDDKITVHMAIPIQCFLTSDGNLRDEEGTVWKKV